MFNSQDFIKSFLGHSCFPRYLRLNDSFVLFEERSFLTYRSLDDIVGSTKIVNSKAINDFIKAFNLPKDLQRNVVLDVSLPISLLFNPSEILLYGCDFDYNLGSRYSSIFESVPDLQWDHTDCSEKSWKNISLSRFSAIQSYFKDKSIELKRIV